MWFLLYIVMLVMQSLSLRAALVTEGFSATPACTTTSIVFPVGCNSLTTTVYSNTIIATSSVDCHGCCKLQLYPLGHCFLPLAFPTTVTAATTTRTRTVCMQSAEASCEPTPGALNGTSISDGNAPSINSTFKITAHQPPEQTSTRRLPPGVGTETAATFTVVTDR